MKNQTLITIVVILNIVIASHDVHDNMAMRLLEILKPRCATISNTIYINLIRKLAISSIINLETYVA